MNHHAAGAILHLARPSKTLIAVGFTDVREQSAP